MSKRIGNVAIICNEPDAKCEFCGKVDELRPYGHMGENICYECAMKDEGMTEKRMRQVLFGGHLDA